MNNERTYAQLAADLEHVYGCNAASVFSVYINHNPLSFTTEQAEQYWEHTRRFLEHLHNVLYAKDHQLSLHSIKPESYFFLTKICLDHAFTVPELINIRNNRESKVAKDMANDIAHDILPPYLTYRRQTLNCSFDAPQNGPGLVIRPPMPWMQPQMPWMQPQMQMPWMQPQMQMPWMQPQMQMPWMQPQMQMPWMQIQTPKPACTTISKPSGSGDAIKKPKPLIIRKPKCVRTGEEKQPVENELNMPTPSDSDEVPLNFYNVYCSDRANKVNNTAEQHHIPQIFPVPNRPPPPQ